MTQRTLLFLVTFSIAVPLVGCDDKPTEPASGPGCSAVCDELRAACAAELEPACSAVSLEAVHADCVLACPESAAPGAGACERLEAIAETELDCEGEPAPACVVGVSRCEGDAVVRCVAGVDGPEERSEACEGATACAADDEGAFCAVCEPNAVTCADEFSRALCTARGDATVVDPCRDGEYCSAGACLPQACAPPSNGCLDEETQWTCDDIGAEMVPTSCDELPACQTEAGCACREDACEPLLCVPGVFQCSGDVLTVCGERADAFEGVRRCADGCTDGACNVVDGCLDAPARVPVEAFVRSESVATVTVENCSDTDLVLFQIGADDVALPGRPNGSPLALELEGVAMDAEGRLETPLFVGPGAVLELPVRFSPVAASVRTGRLTLTGNQGEPHEVEIVAQGLAVNCTTAIVRARVNGVPVLSNPLSLISGDLVELDASASADSELPVDHYEWDLGSRPRRSEAQLLPWVEDPDNPARRALLVDEDGEYLVSLRASAGDRPACNVENINLVVDTPPDFRVVLTWENPEDRDPEDQTANDLDIHLLQMVPEAAWASRPHDCFFGNMEPDWDPGRPVLDADEIDDSSTGPETISMRRASECRWYAVGVHMWRESVGVSNATVQVFVGEQLVSTFEQSLRDGRSFWDVARIHWPTGTVLLVGDVEPDDGPLLGPATVTERMRALELCGLPE